MVFILSRVWKHKMLFIMRLTFSICLFCVLQSFAIGTFSQNVRLSINQKNISVESALQLIEGKTDYYFMYSALVVDIRRTVDIEATNKLVTEILDDIFKGTDTTYKIDGRLVALSKNGEISRVSQQQKSVSGKVTDSSGVPLPGVSVIIKGKTIGTITDANGNYSLTNIPVDATLQYSFVGMKSQEIKVVGKTIISVILQEESIGIEEVVAIGYGTMKKSDLTGAVVSVDMGRKDMTSNIDLSQSLSGYIPGVNSTSSALAGGAGDLSIRGQTSLSASDSPLIVVDGIIFNGTTADINVGDIESIDVLKDASAAAVYGARSANGVIIITTKRGKTEKPTFDFSMYAGFQSPTTTKRMNLMNGEEFAVKTADYFYQRDQLYPWYAKNPTSADSRPVRPDVTDKNVVASYLRNLSEEEYSNYLAGNSVDWVEAVLNTPSPIQNYNLSVSGKTDKTTYFLSGAYTNQEGIVIDDKFKRLTLRSNFENKITDWFSMGLNTSYTHSDMSGMEAIMAYALMASPLANMYDSKGNYPLYLAGESGARHPLRFSQVDDAQIADNLNVLLTAKIKIPQIKGLTYQIDYSNELIFNKHNYFYPTSVFEGSTVGGDAVKESTEERDWLINNIVTYDRTFDKHKINATLLYTRENKKGESSNLEAQNFSNESLGYNAMELGQTQTTETGSWEENSIAYMARANYSYNNRYLLTATFRRDGYSGFGASNKFANFPSFSLGWVLSEESFMKRFEWLNNFKVRASYGQNGNQGIGRYASQATLSSLNYIWNDATSIGLYPGKLGNSDLKWESTTSTNLGIDFSIFNQRISGQIDGYFAKTTNVLVERSVPNASGYSSVWTNVGGIKNKGIEFTLTTHNIKTMDFNWNTRATFSLNRDKITKLYEGVTEDTGNSWFVGHSINAIYGYKNDGVWQEADLFSGKIMSGYYPGQFKVKDLDNSGTITAAGDREILGYSTPNYRFSVYNDFSYKNFKLSIFINSIQGGNGYYLSNSDYSALFSGAGEYRYNKPTNRAYWRPDNAVNNAVGCYYNAKVNPSNYNSRSFVRLQDVTLSYTIPTELIKKIGMGNTLVYVSGKNLYTWTKWAGWDPEIDGDYGYTPMMRTIIAGIKLTF